MCDRLEIDIDYVVGLRDGVPKQDAKPIILDLREYLVKNKYYHSCTIDCDYRVCEITVENYDQDLTNDLVKRYNVQLPDNSNRVIKKTLVFWSDTTITADELNACKQEDTPTPELSKETKELILTLGSLDNIDNTKDRVNNVFSDILKLMYVKEYRVVKRELELVVNKQIDLDRLFQ